MSSLIDGFEYDIFISYRHNDNRSGWVTEFVKALQEELAATIKEPVSVYFDSNPHDGLLETHNVDKSLEGKLKCLIFIPILSQTYCDPKSFAWQHEFVAFNRMAREDQFGRDIKLSNGNVASRILPIKIHDLDAEDKATIENEIGAVLRAIDFIYKESGVNRPLRANEENPGKNQNQTTYRNQLNKVANAVKEVIAAMRAPAQRIAQPQRNTVAGRTGKPSWKTIAMMSLGMMILFALIYGLSQFAAAPDVEPVTVDKSIAVLPFADMSANHDQEFFGDGVAEEIINVLVQVPDLRVIARTSSFQYKGKNEDLRKIGAALGVSTILEGSVRKSKNQLRVTAQLINIADGSHLWSKTYDRSAEDVFKVQDEIAREVVEAMKITLSGKLAPTHPSTTNEDAYNLYRQGMFFLDQASDQGNRKALEFFERAIALDSNLAAGWQGIGTARFRLWQPTNPEWPKVRAAAMKALSLDPRLPEPHVILCLVACTAYDWPLANDEVKKAYALDPKNSAALRNYGRMLFMFGKFNEGMEFVNRAVAIDPVSVNSFSYLGKAKYLAGNFEEALLAYDRASELSPLTSFSIGRIDRSLLTLQLKGPKVLLSQMESEPNPAIKLASTSIAQFVLKQYPEADKNLAGLIKGFSNKNAYEIATAYAYRNDFDNTILWLERAYAQGERPLQLASVDPALKAFRHQPRFKALMKKMNFPE